jgi:ribonuclease-3
MEINPNSTSILENTLNYTFHNKVLLECALTHPSYDAENQEKTELFRNYERLEFLGDAVLGLILAEYLYKTYPEKDEGELARARTVLIQSTTLSSLARQLNIAPFIRVSKIEKSLRAYERDSVLEDCLEALIGAIYLDSDYETATKIILKWYEEVNRNLETSLLKDNPKGRLQELYPAIEGQQRVEYILKETYGPEHQKMFHIEVLIEGKALGEGRGSSKKEAARIAAQEALNSLNI